MNTQTQGCLCGVNILQRKCCFFRRQTQRKEGTLNIIHPSKREHGGGEFLKWKERHLPKGEVLPLKKRKKVPCVRVSRFVVSISEKKSYLQSFPFFKKMYRMELKSLTLRFLTLFF